MKTSINNTQGVVIERAGDGCWIDELHAGSVNISSLSFQVYTATTDATITSAYTLANASSGPMTLTLPDASSVDGRSVKIKKIDDTVNTVTIACSNNQTIDGQSTQVISARWTALEIVSSGGQWYIF